MAFINSKYARASSNVMQGFKTEIISFDSGCDDCVEMCNRDLDAPVVPRINTSRRVAGFSQQAIVLPRQFDETDLEDLGDALGTTRAGAMVWVENPDTGHKHLQIWTGVAWAQIGPQVERSQPCVKP